MNKTKVTIITIIGLLIVGFGSFLLLHKSSASNTNNPPSHVASVQTSSPQPLQGNKKVEAVLSGVKAHVSTVTATRVLTEQTDENNLLGKDKEYQYAGAFYDTATNSSEAVTDNYGTTSGGSIEVFANNSDATSRGAYLEQFQTGAIQAGAYKVVGNTVLRVSENYTATQQKQVLSLMENAL